MKCAYRLAGTFFLISVLFAAATPSQHAQAQGDTCNFTNAAWISTLGSGLNCLDDAGWHSFTSGSDLSSAEGVAVCPDGVYFGSGLDVKKFDGQTTTSLPSSKQIGVHNISCAEKGKIWVSYIDSISYFDGSKWTSYKKQFGTGPFTSILKKVVAGPNGTAWAMTTGSVAHFDGKTWTAYENGSGFTKDYNISDVVVDARGQAWVITGDGVLTFNDGKWSTLANKAISGATSLAVAADGKLWAGTNTGVAVYDGKTWTTYTRQKDKLSANSVRNIALDGQGRVWVGTDYGLDVFDGKTWVTYLMSNSDLLDNSISTIQISNNGPKLPDAKVKKPGSITGLITSGKSPVKGATLQLCTEFVGGIFEGATPCGDNPYTASVKTDDKGIYTLENVPVGSYDFVVQGTDGKWIQFIGIHTKIVVKEGQSTEMPTIDVSNVS